MDRKELEKKIILKAWKDPAFKKNLLENSKKTIELFIKETYPRDISIAANTKFEVVETDQNSFILVLPPSPVESQRTTEVELESIAAGKGAILSPFIGL